MEQFNPKDLERLQKLRLIDDDFMSKCFEDNIECTELILSIILERNDLKVQKVQTQYKIKNLQGRSIILDIYATDKNGKKYNIEVQRFDKGAGAKRARYNSSLIDANITTAGDKYENISETYIIFITEKDALGKNLPIYHIDRVIRETGELFGDESHIIYVNGENTDNSPLGILMQDFKCTNPAEMKYKQLAKRASYFKENKKGVATMCKLLEDMRKEERINIAKTMLKLNKLSIEEVAQCSNLTIQEVKDIEAELSK